MTSFVSRRTQLFYLIAFSLLFLYWDMLCWLQTTDVYYQHFAENGPIVIIYNFLRSLFILYLFWLSYWPGWAILRLVAGPQAVATLPIGTRYALGFFAGAACWHIILFPIGLAGGLSISLALVSTTLVMIASLPHLVSCLDEAVTGVPKFFRVASPIYKTAAIVTAICAVLFLFTRILYPGGWYDYYTHYLHFYNAAVERGTTRPNEIWQHFFYSKGAGLYFLAMLLIDSLSPGLVAGTFMLTGALVVFLLVRRAGEGLWPWAACILYLGLQVYIRGSEYGNWGEMQKLHSLTAANALAVLFCTISLRDQPAPLQKLWLGALILMLVQAIIFAQAMSFIYSIFFALVAIAWWLQRFRREAFLALICLATLLLCLAGMMTINYIYTGIPEDHFINILWNRFSLHKLQQWGYIFETFTAHFDQVTLQRVMVNNSWKFTFMDAGQHLYRILRLDLLWPLYLLAMARVIWIWKQKGDDAVRAYVSGGDLIVYLAIILACSVFAMTSGRIEVTSFYRFSFYIFPPMICLAAFCLNRYSARSILLPVDMTALCLAMAYGSYRFVHVRDTVMDGFKFVAGRYSLDDAHSHQAGLPVDDIGGAIHPAVRAACAITGRGTRVWALNSYMYGQLPGCRIETFMAFNLSPHTDRILLGNAAEAKRLLQAAGLNYFLVSPTIEIRDPLPRSELFSPDHIAKYLAVRWTDGDAVLLTWPDADTKPLSKAWIERYRKTALESSRAQDYPMEVMAEVFRKIREGKGDHLPPLPWQSEMGSF